MNKLLKLATAIAFAGSLTLSALAVVAAPYVEAGDAGGTIATAQNVGSGIDRIFGFSAGDDDIYELNYDTPVLFQAFDIHPFSWGFFDLFIRDSGGTALDTCWDCFFWAGDDATTVMSVNLSPGLYYLEFSPTYGESLAYDIGITQTSGAYTATATVSEPATLALFGLGLAGLGYIRRRRTI